MPPAGKWMMVTILGWWLQQDIYPIASKLLKFFKYDLYLLANAKCKMQNAKCKMIEILMSSDMTLLACMLACLIACLPNCLLACPPACQQLPPAIACLSVGTFKGRNISISLNIYFMFTIFNIWVMDSKLTLAVLTPASCWCTKRLHDILLSWYQTTGLVTACQHLLNYWRKNITLMNNA